MPGMVDCHLHPSHHFRAGVFGQTLLEQTLDTLVASELMFRNTTYAREVSMRAVLGTIVAVCFFILVIKVMYNFTVNKLAEPSMIILSQESAFPPLLAKLLVYCKTFKCFAG